MLYVQQSLFGGGRAPDVDATFDGIVRTELAGGAWVDHLGGWLVAPDDVFAALAENLPWRHKMVTMYGRRLPEPRLSSWWRAADGPEPLPVLATMRTALCARYGVAFDSIGFNLYRNGNDSVAWHGDTKGPPVPEPVVAIVSVGEPRQLRLRPRHTCRVDTPAPGARTAAFGHELGHGDLFVMGGTCQREWEHAVPKVRRAGARMSITYRHSGVY